MNWQGKYIRTKLSNVYPALCEKCEDPIRVDEGVIWKAMDKTGKFCRYAFFCNGCDRGQQVTSQS